MIKKGSQRLPFLFHNLRFGFRVNHSNRFFKPLSCTAKIYMHMHNFLTITWDMPFGLDLGFITLRYYSLLFAGGFFAGYFVIKKMFAAEKAPDSWLDSLVTYMVIATVLGARLGHVFFYEWDYYKEHPGKILKVWEGGLASHGAAIAIIVALIIFSKKVTKKSPLWILDRIVIVVALAACFIRVGNYMNSEIYGKPANSAIETIYLNPVRQSVLNAYGDRIEKLEFKSLGTVLETDSINYPQYTMTATFFAGQDGPSAKAFVERYVASRINQQNIDELNVIIPLNSQASLNDVGGAAAVSIAVLGVPRYPTQWIEAGAYLLIFLILFFLYWKTDRSKQAGFLFGSFLVLLFGTRFFVEYLKANQVAFEQNMQLNMGQWLSIPLVLVGLYFIFTSKKNTDEQSA